MNTQTAYDRLWKKRVSALNAVLPKLLDGNLDALHKARVASRRIREALPVVGAASPVDKVKKLGRRMRDLTRLLGPIRELDVEIGLLDKDAAGADVSLAALATVRREVAAERHELRSALESHPDATDLKKLVKKLRRLGEAIRHDDGRKARKREAARRGVLAARLLRRAKRLAASLEQAGPLYAPERIHGVRVSTKKLRYALEIAYEAGEKRAAALVEPLKKHQQRLGRLHDIEALLRHVRKAETLAGAGSGLDELNTYADTLERECRRLHADYVEHRKVLLDCVNQVRQDLVPALTQERKRQARVVEPRRRASDQPMPVVPAARSVR